LVVFLQALLILYLALERNKLGIFPAIRNLSDPDFILIEPKIAPLLFFPCVSTCTIY